MPQLCPPLNPIPHVEPHLMPFHIHYSGYAPVSTYFRVKSDFDSTETSNVDEKESTENESKGKIQRLKKRVISAFRGRRLKGVIVDVPEGYTGVILQADDEVDPASGSLGPPRKHRHIPIPFKGSKRSTRRNATLEVENDASPEVDTEQSAAETKVLRPVGKFNSITIWSPDVDVDETYDEYIRTLDSYRRLLEEIHRTEPTATPS